MIYLPAIQREKLNVLMISLVKWQIYNCNITYKIMHTIRLNQQQYQNIIWLYQVQQPILLKLCKC
jgi:hypothetical protein